MRECDDETKYYVTTNDTDSDKVSLETNHTVQKKERHVAKLYIITLDQYNQDQAKKPKFVKKSKGADIRKSFIVCPEKFRQSNNL